MRPIKLTSYNLQKLGIREWGIPTGCYIGKLWRSQKHRTVTCLLPIPNDTNHLRTETRSILIVDRAEEQWLPATWRRSMGAYKRQWPGSAPRLLRLPRTRHAPNPR